jgi:hypothetical protein
MRAGIAFGAHRRAAALGGATHFQAGDNTSAIAHHEISDEVLFRACVEIAILEYKPASQENDSLVDDFFPGAHTLTRIDFAMVINIQARPHRQRNALIRKVGGVNLEGLLPCFYIFPRRIKVVLPLLQVLW